MNQQKISVFVFCWMMFLSSAAQFDDLLFKHITRANGLPVSEVTCLAQDSSGFIWIGSMEGLFRYDGFNFIGQYANPQNKQSLPGNAIEKITVSKKGMLWIATLRSGVACMTPDGKVISIFNSATTPDFSKHSDYVNDIQEDHFGNLWWTTADGLFRFSTEGKLNCFRIELYEHPSNGFGKFQFDGSGKLWLAGFGGLIIFDPVKQSFTHASKEPYKFKDFIEKSQVNTIAIHNNKIWHSSYLPDVGVFDTSKRVNTTFYSGKGLLQPNYDRMVRCFFVDSKRNLWIGTGEGLFFSSTGSLLDKSFLHNADNPYSICDNNVTAILEDREGNFWFGTKNGISITQPYKKQILNFSTNNLNQHAFGNQYISKIIEVNNNTLLIGTTFGKGLYQTDKKFRVQKIFSFNNVAYDWIRAYYNDEKRQRIFVSTQEGMLLYDKYSGKVEILKSELFKRWHPVSSFVATSDSIIYMSRFRNSFVRYNLISDHYIMYHLNDLGLDPNSVVHLAIDKQDKLWLISQSGIVQFNEHTGKVAQQLTEENTTQSLRQTAIRFFRDLGDVFIIGYDTKGISIYHKKNRSWEHFTKSDGLVSNNTMDAVVVKDGSVWIATRNGLSHFNPVSKAFNNYGFDRGILNTQFTCISQLQDGRIVAGTSKGVVAFHPSEIDAPTIVQLPIITEINVYGNTIPANNLLYNHPVKISYKRNYFSIEYISLNYTNKSEIEYSYKLEGVDNDWVTAGDRRFASYSNLTGGNYQFHVRARYPGGEWVHNNTPLPIFVNAAYYTKWWFYLLCAIVAGLIMYIFFRYRLQQILAVERMRTSISNDLHDEVGASLTSISIFSEIARKHVIPSTVGEQYLLRIGDRSRESIEKMSDIIWSINPDNDSLQQMLVRMKNYSTEICEAKDINVEWVESGNLASSKLTMEQRKNFYLIFKEIMNNIIKHAAAKNIFIKLESINNCIHLNIKDDGKGFDLDIANQGNGLKNLQRRTSQLNGELNINSKRDKGTIINLEFPI